MHCSIDQPKDHESKHQPKKKQPQISISLSSPALSSLVSSYGKISKSSKQINDAYHSLFHTRPSYRLFMRDLIKADISIIDKRSFLLCPHRHHCIQNAFMKGFWRTFAAAFIFKTSLSLFTALFSGKLFNFRNGKISWQRVSKIFLNQDSLLFGQIFGLISFTYKVILCSLRRYRLRDPIWHKTVAGFISGIWILLDNRNRRNTIALYCIFRAISDLLRLSVAYKKLPNIQYFDVMTFTATQVIICYCFKDPTGFDPKYYKFIKYIGSLKENVLQNTFRAPHKPFVECCPKYHIERTCLQYNINSWFDTFYKATKMYLLVHFVPTILLTPKTILCEPFVFMKRKSWNTIISAMFVATYGFIAKYTVCRMRNVVRDDPWWIFCLGGFISGLSLFEYNECDGAQNFIWNKPLIVLGFK